MSLWPRLSSTHFQYPSFQYPSGAVVEQSRLADIEIDTLPMFLAVYSSVFATVPAHETAYLTEIYGFLEPQLRSPSALS